MLKVNKIYPAYMGEVNKFGIGYPCTFVRLAGCNMRCYHSTFGLLCDTPEALTGGSGKEMSIDDVVKRVIECSFGNKLICLTGGEPLLQKEASFLIGRLSALGFHIVVETNGSQNISHLVKNVSYVVDYKLRSTGETDKMLPAVWKNMTEDDYLKFVVYDLVDYTEMLKWVSEHKDFRGNIAAGLFWGSHLSYVDFSKRLHKDCPRAILNMQTHKMEVLYDKYKSVAGNIFIPKDL